MVYLIHIRSENGAIFVLHEIFDYILWNFLEVTILWLFMRPKWFMIYEGTMFADPLHWFSLFWGIIRKQSKLGQISFYMDFDFF